MQITAVAGNGTQASTDGNGVEAEFASPNAICYSAAAGVFFISELDSCQIRSFSAASARSATLSGIITSELIESGWLPIPQLISIILDFATHDSKWMPHNSV